MTTSTEAMLDTIEATLDHIEGNLDKIERSIPKSKYALIGSVIVISAAAGAVVGYFFAKRRLQNIYDDIAKQEIEQARLFYAAMGKKGKFADPVQLSEKYEDSDDTDEVAQLHALTRPYRVSADAMEQARATLEEVTGRNIEPVDPDAIDGPGEFRTSTKPELFMTDEEKEEEARRNVFDTSEPADPDFDYEAEIRTEDAPYVITYEEFSANENNYQQITFTYFEGDDILADERDQIVADVDGTVGIFNLSRFGHGSRDNNIVYIRNHALDLEFEVCKSKNSYETEVLGIIQHSDRRPLRRFRSTDE